MKELDLLLERLAASRELLATLQAGERSLLRELEISSIKSMIEDLEEDERRLRSKSIIQPFLAHRLIADRDERLTLDALLGAVGPFGRAISLIRESLATNRPILRARFGDGERALPSLYPLQVNHASLELQLGVPLTRLGSVAEFEQALDVFSKLTAGGDEYLNEMVKQLGPAPIRSVLDWAKFSYRNGLNVEVRAGEDLSMIVFRKEVDALGMLAESLSRVDAPEVSEIVVEGVLDGGRLSENRFWLIDDEGEGYAGSVAPGALIDQRLNARLRVRLEKTASYLYSRDRIKVTYTLLEATEL